MNEIWGCRIRKILHLVLLRRIFTHTSLCKSAVHKMVFTTIAAFIRARGPDEFWRKRKIFKLSAHFLGRRRNCYSVAIRNVHRALAYATKGRKLKKDDMQELWDTRIAAACTQFGITHEALRDSLSRNNVLLNRKVLADLAIWEPKTFEAIINTCRQRAVNDGIDGINEKQIDNKLVNKII